MARFQCKCGATLSNSDAPNDVELIVFTDREWDDIINLGDLIDPVTIPSPRNDVWRCSVCERIYMFDGNTVVKTYGLENFGGNQLNENCQADKIILAQYNKQTVRVYQAYNHKIADDEVLTLGQFGPSFKIDRMTWIKPSFLWMMYRSGWATKADQERILAIDITREGFNHILSQVVLSSYDRDLYASQEEWQTELQASQVRCQWDPDRDIYGNKLPRRAIQLGIRGDMVHKYIHEWIVEINDITEFVIDTREAIQSGKFSADLLPKESPYPVEEAIKRTLGIFK